MILSIAKKLILSKPLALSLSLGLLDLPGAIENM